MITEAEYKDIYDRLPAERTRKVLTFYYDRQGEFVSNDLVMKRLDLTHSQLNTSRNYIIKRFNIVQFTYSRYRMKLHRREPDAGRVKPTFTSNELLINKVFKL